MEFKLKPFQWHYKRFQSLPVEYAMVLAIATWLTPMSIESTEVGHLQENHISTLVEIYCVKLTPYEILKSNMNFYVIIRVNWLHYLWNIYNILSLIN